MGKESQVLKDEEVAEQARRIEEDFEFEELCNSSTKLRRKVVGDDDLFFPGVKEASIRRGNTEFD